MSSSIQRNRMVTIKPKVAARKAELIASYADASSNYIKGNNRTDINNICNYSGLSY